MKIRTLSRHPSANPSGLPHPYPGPRREKPFKVGSPNVTPVPEHVVTPIVEPLNKMASKWAPTPAKMLKPDPL